MCKIVAKTEAERKRRKICISIWIVVRYMLLHYICLSRYRHRNPKIDSIFFVIFFCFTFFICFYILIFSLNLFHSKWLMCFACMYTQAHYTVEWQANLIILIRKMSFFIGYRYRFNLECLFENLRLCGFICNDVHSHCVPNTLYEYATKQYK